MSKLQVWLHASAKCMPRVWLQIDEAALRQPPLERSTSGNLVGRRGLRGLVAKNSHMNGLEEWIAQIKINNSVQVCSSTLLRYSQVDIYHNSSQPSNLEPLTCGINRGIVKIQNKGKRKMFGRSFIRGCPQKWKELSYSARGHQPAAAALIDDRFLLIWFPTKEAASQGPSCAQAGPWSENKRIIASHTDWTNLWRERAIWHLLLTGGKVQIFDRWLHNESVEGFNIAFFFFYKIFGQSIFL